MNIDQMAASASGNRDQGEELRGHSRSESFTSAQKTRAVLRLLRGEPSEALSEEFGVSIRRLERWQEEFILGGRNALARRKDLGSNNWLREHAVPIQQWFWLLLALGVAVSMLAMLVERGGE
jgi:Helix-turn-helix domain